LPHQRPAHERFDLARRESFPERPEDGLESGRGLAEEGVEVDPQNLRFESRRRLP